jgi:hypothetical protein
MFRQVGRQLTVMANVSGRQPCRFGVALISRICSISPSHRSGASGSCDLRQAWSTSESGQQVSVIGLVDGAKGQDSPHLLVKQRTLGSAVSFPFL